MDVGDNVRGEMSGGKCPEGKYPGGNIRGGGEMSEGGGNIREGGNAHGNMFGGGRYQEYLYFVPTSHIRHHSITNTNVERLIL